MPEDTIIRGQIIHGQVTLEWGDQVRFLAGPYAKALSKYAAITVVVFGAVWASMLSDEDWLRLRTEPLALLGHFVADVWPFYLGTFTVLALVMVGHSAISFLRYPHINRQLSYEATPAGLTTRDAADFALSVPWASVIRIRNTRRVLHLKTVTRAWRYVLWRAFAPEDREQILRWATRAETKAAPVAKEPISAG